MVYVLSVEPVIGEAFRWGFHFGTDLELAKNMAVEIFDARNSSVMDVDDKGHRMPTRTVALLLNDRIVDVYDGMEWDSDRDYEYFPQYGRKMQEVDYEDSN